VRPGRSAVELSLHPLVALMHKENLGDPHPVLAGGERYVSHRHATESEQWLHAELAEAGVADRDRLADLVGMVSIIQRARTEFYGWVADHDDTYSLLVAAHGRNAFALTRRGDRVAFRRVSPDRLAEALVRRLPHVPAGHGEPLAVREAELARPRSAPARRLVALFQAPRRGGAKLYAARRDDTGNRVRSRDWLDLLDLPEGRWAVYATRTRGERAINAATATPAQVARNLTELIRSTHRRGSG
jgi:hypothetical protein